MKLNKILDMQLILSKEEVIDIVSKAIQEEYCVDIPFNAEIVDATSRRSVDGLLISWTTPLSTQSE